MKDIQSAEAQPPVALPRQESPARALTHVGPDTDDALPHLGVVGDTYTILVFGQPTPTGALYVDRHARPTRWRTAAAPSRLRGNVHHPRR